MSVPRMVRWSIVFSFVAALVAVAAEDADAQIFRRPVRSVQPHPATKPAEAKAFEPDRSIITPSDEKPFQVGATDWIRLPAYGITGSEFSAKIEGPARLRRKAYVAKTREGEFSVGGAEAEFEFEPTGPGKVKIDVIVKYPNGPKPKVTTYQIEVAPARKYPSESDFAPAPAPPSSKSISPNVQ